MALPELNTARYEMVIPSTGDTISFRPYLVKEEKILMMAMESNDNKVIMKATADVIKSCVNDELDIDELAMFDIETIFLELRSKSVGETVDLKIKCEDEECDVVNDIVINFDDIESIGDFGDTDEISSGFRDFPTISFRFPESHEIL